MKGLPRNFPWCEWRGGIRVFIAVTFLFAPLLTSAATVDTYAQLTGKTVLAPFALPSVTGSSPELPKNKTNAIALLEQEFSKMGISVVQDGPCFVRLVPTGERQADTGWMPFGGAQLHASASQQLMPAGTVNFLSTDANQVLEIYADLKGRTILRSRILPAPTIHFKTQCPLTREELVYALETVLALNGLGAVDDGHFVQIVPIRLRSM